MNPTDTATSETVNTRVICKICEKSVALDTLSIHSLKCKEVEEAKQKLFLVKESLISIVNQSYDLKNQLNTNAALRKYKFKRVGAYTNDELDSPPVLSSKKKPTIKMQFKEDHQSSSSSDSDSDSDSSSSEEQPEQTQVKTEVLDSLKNTSGNSRGVKKSINTIIIDPQAEEDDFAPQIARARTQVITRDKIELNELQEFIEEEKSRKFEDEFNKTMFALKRINNYGRNFDGSLDEIGDDDTILDLSVKNEVNILYEEIVDVGVSAYLKKFIDTVEEFVLMKRNYHNKVDELESFIVESTSPGKPSLNRQKTLELSQRRTRKRHITLLTSMYPSSLGESSSDSKTDKSDETSEAPSIVRTMSARTPVTQSPDTLRNTRLSRFATAKKSSEGSLNDSGNEKKDKHSILNSGVEVESQELLLTPEKNVSKDMKFEFAMAEENGNEHTKVLNLRRIPNNTLKIPRGMELEITPDSSPQLAVLLSSFIALKEKGGMKELSNFKSDERIPSINVRLASRDKLSSSSSDDSSDSDSDSDSQVENDNLQCGNETTSKNYDSKSGMLDLRTAPGLSLSDLHMHEDAKTPTAASNLPSLMKFQHAHGFDSEEERNCSTATSVGKKLKERKHLKQYDSPTIRGYYSDSTIYESKKTSPRKEASNEFGIQDFEFLKKIGEGAYGKIYLVRKKVTGDIYAMKIVDFVGQERTSNFISNLQAEKDVYASIKGDWVVKALYTFSYENYVCFVLEYMSGGDFIKQLEDFGCFNEVTARFYFAELVLALESLHALGIIHRDLKPDNIMIDAKGHLKLTDFGLSEKGFDLIRRQSIMAPPEITRTNFKFQRMMSMDLKDSIPSRFKRQEDVNTPMNQLAAHLLNPNSMFLSHKKEEEVIFGFLDNVDKNKSGQSWKSNGQKDTPTNTKKKGVFRIVGTPDYMAPEVIRGDNCGHKSLDLWSLGVILYEFLAGVPPFNDDSVAKIFKRIEKCDIEWPEIGYGEDSMTPEAVDLIKCLLNPLFYKRITINQIKDHAFFKGFDWDNVKKMTPPIIPDTKDEKSIGSPMIIQNIFRRVETSGSQNKGARRDSFTKNKMQSFNMKRVDLLHQLNEQTYCDFK